MFAWFLLATIPALGSITFESNRGQTDPRVQFLARTANGVVFATAQEIILYREHREKLPAVRFSFENANPQANWQGLDPTGHKTYYMIGRDPKQHAQALDSFQKLTRKNIYPGIDLVLYGNSKNQLEYDLVLAPGADPSRIRVRAQAAHIDPKTGDLVILGTTRQHKPIVFQNNKIIDGRFKQIAPNTFGFEIAAYDKNEPLVIDPVIESRDYIGGIGDDSISSVGPRNSVAGTTTSIDFPGAPIALRHGKDVFYRRDGITYIMGGSGDEVAANCDLSDVDNQPMIAGTTNSIDLPTKGAALSDGNIRRNFGGGATDGFLWHPAAGMATYFGGAGEDRITAIMTTAARFAFTGSTNSGGDFPIGVNQPPAGGFDAFLASGSIRLRSDQSYTLGISVLHRFGGTGDDHGLAIIASLSSRDEYVIAGETSSPTLPSLQGTRKGPSDAFFARYADIALGSAITLQSAILLGGNGSDRVQALAWSPSRNLIYAAGGTNSVDFPLQQPAQASFGGGPLDAFYATLSGDLASLRYSTYLGGNGSDEALSIAADSLGNAYVGGRTTSTNLAQRNPSQNGFGGGSTDALFAQYDSTGVARHVAYYGGSGDDEILALGDVRPGFVSVGGITTSIDLPGTGIGILEPRRFGTNDGFHARFSIGLVGLPIAVFSARDSRLAVSIGVGDLGNPKPSGRATARSSDGSRVRITFFRSGPAVTEDAFEWFAGSNDIPRELHVECLTNDGEANITVSSAGLGDSSMRVRCAQPELQPLAPFPALLFSNSLTSVRVQATDPATGEIFFLTDAVTPGVTRRIAIDSSNPQVAVPGNVLTLQPDPNTSPGGSFRILPISVGTTTFTASALNYKSLSATVTVLPATGAPRVIETIPGVRTSDRATTSRTGVTTVIRSLNPSRVLLSDFNANLAPSAQITLPGIGEYNIDTQSDAPIGSEIGIEMSTNGTPAAVTRTVRIVEGNYGVSLNGSPLPAVIDLRLAETVTLDVLPQPFSGSPAPTFESSNPSVVPTPASGYRLTLSGLAEGTSLITIRPPAGFRYVTNPITVRVARAAFQLQPFYLGNGLVETRTIALPVGSTENVTISTSTPDLIQLERVSGGGLASTIVEPANGRRLIPFRVHGKAQSGQGSITVNIPGYAPVATTLRLYPAGFFWSAEEIRLTAGDSQPLLAIGPVDPITGLSLAIQAFSDPSAAPVPTINNTNSSAAIFSSPASVRAVAAGQAILTIRQPAGFGSAVIRQVLKVVVPTQPQVSTQGLLRMSLAGGSGFIGGTYTCSTSPCFTNPNIGAQIQLFANPSAGFIFAGWTGACSGSAACNITATASSMDVTAIFAVDTGLHFLPVAPCRIVDTRNANGPLGGPALQGTRNFPMRSSCGMPASAAAYSLNITVVPRATLGYITIWPGGLTQPIVSTLNSLDGRIKANAAIVPAADLDGSINLFATDLTDVIIDVNGVFVPKPATTVGQSFYAVTPCRIADTRLSGGALQAQVTRGFAVANAGGCGVPVTATAYALNVTVVPRTSLGFLTLWPGGLNSTRPIVSTLNALTGTVTANMAIVPAGSAGEINAYATDSTEMILDVTGYFAPPGQANALSFRTLPPCRIADTRSPDSIMNAVSTRDFAVPCGSPSNAKAYSVNATVLPSAILGYLTLYPAGSARPAVSTLNAVDGALTSNAAIVPAGLNGGISAFVTERTHLILDINGYFAP